ncbi:MAG: DUF3021 domain-containing protein [Ethanoligenens sp.]
MKKTMTFKRAMLWGLLGFPLGVFVSYTITIAISLAGRGWGGGWYSPVDPTLSRAVGSQLAAVGVQYLLSGLLGFVFAAGSCIWGIEKWNYTRQTVVHFALVTGTMMLMAYVCNWFDHTLLAFGLFFGLFVVIYVIIWFCCYLTWKKKMQVLNDSLRRHKRA